MMRTAYFDCFSGVSGDMALGALIQCGVEPDRLKELLSGLDLGDWSLSAERVSRHGIGALRVTVHAPDAHGHGRHLADIEHIIERASLPAWVAQSAASVFAHLAEAEARIHQTDVQSLHFHEVGAVDAIIDIVGACALLHELGVDHIAASPLPMGHGFVECMHGTIPLPAPAVIELTRGIPTYGVDVEGELVTPTGAAILAALAAQFGPAPPMKVMASGYGAGSRDLPDRPNLLRVVIGEGAAASGPDGPCGSEDRDDIAVIETNMDDLSPQFYDTAMARLFAAGALDVFTHPVQMKKNRPGTMLTVLCRPVDVDLMAAVLFAETTTLGIRVTRAQRRCMERSSVVVSTEYGDIRVKTAWWGEEIAKAMPEYDDVKHAAEQSSTPAPVVWESALAAYRMKGTKS